MKDPGLPFKGSLNVSLVLRHKTNFQTNLIKTISSLNVSEILGHKTNFKTNLRPFQ
jgi:hypothetical protein